MIFVFDFAQATVSGFATIVPLTWFDSYDTDWLKATGSSVDEANAG